MLPPKLDGGPEPAPNEPVGPVLSSAEQDQGGLDFSQEAPRSADEARVRTKESAVVRVVSGSTIFCR